MSEWHLDELRAALLNKGWKLVAVHGGDGHAVSGSWEIQRSTRHPPLWLDFNGRDDLKCLPMSESYACEVRGLGPQLYFRRPGDKWRTELEAFVCNLDALTCFPRPTLPLRRIEDERTMSDMLAARRAILCLHAEWSMPSHMAWKSFQNWTMPRAVEGASGVDGAITVFVAINSDHYPQPVVEWLKAQGLEQFQCSGWGEILWLENGRVVSRLIYSPAGILPALTQRTVDLWGATRPSIPFPGPV